FENCTYLIQDGHVAQDKHDLSRNVCGTGHARGSAPTHSSARFPNTGDSRTATQAKLGVSRKQAAVSKEMRM
ncbi:hypothetical protein, partial [Thiolapillus sp.]|uniref:hypothetical protein n=1 Tax=Thiolapillus sp. TaxID=2017437 RepID=UPI003AF9F8F3